MSSMSQQRRLTESETCRVVGPIEGTSKTTEAIGIAQSMILRIWSRFLETENARLRPG